MNDKTFNPREFAKEKVHGKPQIDLERREIPSSVETPFDDYNKGVSDARYYLLGLMQAWTEKWSLQTEFADFKSAYLGMKE